MKTLKTFQTLFLMIILSILTGCSDQITSSGETGSSEKGEEVISASSLPIKLPVVPTFRAQVRLKPFRTYTFDLFSTGFDRLYSIDIDNIPVKSEDKDLVFDCSKIAVYSLSNGSLLDCHSSGIDVKEITVENKSSDFLDLEVSIRGVKQKKEIKQTEKK